MKIFKYLFSVTFIFLIVIFQSFLQSRNYLASGLRDGGKIFRNDCAVFHIRIGLVVLNCFKSLKIFDLEKRGIADLNSIAKIANDGFGYMNGYKNKLKDGEDKIIAKWIIQNA